MADVVAGHLAAAALDLHVVPDLIVEDGHGAGAQHGEVVPDRVTGAASPIADRYGGGCALDVEVVLDGGPADRQACGSVRGQLVPDRRARGV
jgi:hypothetical protein